jgi:hypothetical protein
MPLGQGVAGWPHRRLWPPATARQGVPRGYSIGLVFTRLGRFRHLVSSENAGPVLGSRRLTDVRFRDGRLVDVLLLETRASYVSCQAIVDARRTLTEC